MNNSSSNFFVINSQSHANPLYNDYLYSFLSEKIIEKKYAQSVKACKKYQLEASNITMKLTKKKYGKELELLSANASICDLATDDSQTVSQVSQNVKVADEYFEKLKPCLNKIALQNIFADKNCKNDIGVLLESICKEMQDHNSLTKLSGLSRVNDKIFENKQKELWDAFEKHTATTIIIETTRAACEGAEQFPIEK